MNSLNFYNEYLTAGEREKARQWGQNISEPPKQEKQSLKLTDKERVEYEDIYYEYVKDEDPENLSDEQLVQKCKNALLTEHVSFQPIPTNKPLRFVIIKDGPAYFAKRVYGLINIHEGIIEKVHFVFTREFLDIWNVFKEPDKYLLGIYKNGKVIGLTDGYYPKSYERDFCPTGDEVIHHFGDRLKQYGLDYSIFEKIGDRLPTENDFPEVWGE